MKLRGKDKTIHALFEIGVVGKLWTVSSKLLVVRTGRGVRREREGTRRETGS